MLKRYVSEEVTKARAEVAQEERSGWFSGVRSPETVYRFVVIGTLLSLGGGFVIRLANVFFHYDLHATSTRSAWYSQQARSFWP
ncbi:MAG: hypothetical protein Ct9H300mP30_0840 [Methanobacteriota archaeon]|nr:MAG: hypothetical protein Ct9H300mP30_0840 [Euryarchaeota archaeon]